MNNVVHDNWFISIQYVLNMPEVTVHLRKQLIRAVKIVDRINEYL